MADSRNVKSNHVYHRYQLLEQSARELQADRAYGVLNRCFPTWEKYPAEPGNSSQGGVTGQYKGDIDGYRQPDAVVSATSRTDETRRSIREMRDEGSPKRIIVHGYIKFVDRASTEHHSTL